MTPFWWKHWISIEIFQIATHTHFRCCIQRRFVHCRTFDGFTDQRTTVCNWCRANKTLMHSGPRPDRDDFSHSEHEPCFVGAKTSAESSRIVSEERVHEERALGSSLTSSRMIEVRRNDSRVASLEMSTILRFFWKNRIEVDSQVRLITEAKVSSLTSVWCGKNFERSVLRDLCLRRIYQLTKICRLSRCVTG